MSELPEYEVNWTPDDCEHAHMRVGMRHIHPQDCFVFELSIQKAECDEWRRTATKLAAELEYVGAMHRCQSDDCHCDRASAALDEFRTMKGTQ